MKQFLLKTTLLVLVLLSLLSVLHMALPAFWGNDIINDKLKYLNTFNPCEFDTYFIGSSRVNHHINPKLFDRKTKSNSFNLGCPALSGYEALRVAEHLLEEENLSTNTHTLFIEMPILTFNKGKNAESTRGSYYFDLEAFRMSLQNMFTENIPKWIVFKRSLFQLSTVIKNFLILGQLSDAIQCLLHKIPAHKVNRFKQAKGYIPLLVNGKNNGDLTRRKDFLKDTSILVKRLREAEQYISKRKNLDPTNAFLLSKIQQLISKGESQGIRIVFVLFPKSNGIIYKKTLNTFTKLPIYNRINLATPEQYKAYYFSDLSFDKAHLNKRGAEKLTKDFAEASIIANNN